MAAPPSYEQPVAVGQVVPTVQAGSVINPLSQGGMILQQHSAVKVIQKPSLLEGVTGGACEMRNQYNVYGGPGFDQHLFIAQEQSSGCTRCCCNPYHNLTVQFSSPQNPGQVLFTMERRGQQFPNCCAKCLWCWACGDMCNDGMILHAGDAGGGVAGDLKAPAPIMMVRQPTGGGGCNPTLDLNMANGEEAGEAIGQLTGPMCFGGCSELCCDQTFTYAFPDGSTMGATHKLKPNGFCEVCTEMCTDSDKFQVDFEPNATAENRAAMLASTVMVDYMFYELDQGMCRIKDNTCYITCCLCFCYGCLCPCECIIPLKQG